MALALAGGTIAALAGARITRGVVPAVLNAAGAVLAALVTGAIAVIRRPWPDSVRCVTRLAPGSTRGCRSFAG